MQAHRVLGIFLMATLWGGAGQTADFSDPTWPCIQRKVDRLSLGLMWPYLPEEGHQLDAATAKDVAELADLLSLRRVELDSLTDEIAAFGAQYDGDKEILAAVFAQVFDTLSTRRTRIIDGIAKFSLSQIALAENIDIARSEMTTLLAADEPDFDRVDVLEERIDWDQVIHSDRQRSISYLCETPQLLERRLFSVAQALLQVVKDA